MRNGYTNYTLLHDTAIHNSTSCIRVLLRFAPHLVDSVDKWSNQTPLMLAVRSDRGDAAKLLLRAGADVRRKDIDDRTVFDYALNNEKMLKILKQHQQVSGIF